MKRTFRIVAGSERTRMFSAGRHGRGDVSRRKKNSRGKGVKFRGVPEPIQSKVFERSRSPGSENRYAGNQMNNNNRSSKCGDTVDFVDEELEAAETIVGDVPLPSQSKTSRGQSLSETSVRKLPSKESGNDCKEDSGSNLSGEADYLARLEESRVSLPDLLKPKKNRIYVSIFLIILNLVGLFFYTDFCPFGSKP